MAQKTFLHQWLILGAGLLSLTAFVAVDLGERRVTDEKLEQERLLALTKVIEVDLEQNLSSVNTILASLQKQVRESTSEETLNRRLRMLVEAMPTVRTINIHDADGRISASSRAEVIGVNAGFASRDYFKVPKANPSLDTLYVSPPFRTVTGIFSIALARMIPAPDGRFGGVVVATLDPEYFLPLINSSRYAEDSVTTLYHGDGVVFLIAPDSWKNLVGVNLDKPGSLFHRHKESGIPAEVIRGVPLSSPTQGEFMIAHRDIRPESLKMDKPIGISISRKIDAVLAPWRHEMIVRLGILGLVTLLLSSGLYLFQRMLRQGMLERKLDEEKLRESEARYRFLAENSHDVIWTMDFPSMKFTYVSPSVLRLRGMTPEEIMAEPVEEAMTPESREIMSAYIKEALDQLAGGIPPSPRVAEIHQPHKDGHIVPTEVVTTWILDGEGRPRTILGVTRDITERKLMEREREEALSRVKSLEGIIPICMHCKQIRDDMDSWSQLEKYISEHSGAVFSHSICPNCLTKHYPEFCEEPGKKS